MYLYKDGITREANDQPTIDTLLKAGYVKVEESSAGTEQEKSAQKPEGEESSAGKPRS